MEKEIKCHCDQHRSAGDSTPCLWECKEHGITGHHWAVRLLESIEVEYDLDKTYVKRWAWDLLRELQKKHRPYYDEDYFGRDLKSWFERKFGKTETQIEKKLLDIQPEIIGESIFKSWVPDWVIDWVTK